MSGVTGEVVELEGLTDKGETVGLLVSEIEGEWEGLGLLWPLYCGEVFGLGGWT